MSSTIRATAGDTVARPRRWPARVVAVLLAALAAVVIWIIAVPVAGADLKARLGSGQPVIDINLVSVILGALVASLLGWALLAILERSTRRPMRIWTVVAVIVLLLSLAGPSMALNGGAKVVLVLMHLSVGVVLIALMRRTVRT